ncbi:MAG: polyhydroxyalkanoic acid system family protein [Sandaracinaceae bacterium]
MKHRIHHGLEPALAKTAINKAMEAYSARFSDFSPTFEWVSDYKGLLAFKAKGVKVAGEIEIVGPEVTVDLDVPLILRIFKGKAIEIIEEEVQKWCAKARAGEL